MNKYNIFNISQADRNNLCKRVIESSAPRFDFYFLVVLSTLFVSLGLIADNIILVIGGMLITPILSPILAISLGIVIRNFKVIVRSIRIFLVSFLLACFVAFFVGMMVDFNLADISLINNLEVNGFMLAVALVAGMAASYTWAKPNLSETMPGIAITVTLIPPITAIGLAFAASDIEMIMKIFYVLVLNVVGILAASTLVFILMQFNKSKRKIISEIKEEEKELKKKIKKQL